MKRSEMYLDILSYLDTQRYESSFLNLMRRDLKDLADNNKKVEKLGLDIADEHIPVMGRDSFYLPSMTGVNISVVTRTRTPHLNFPEDSVEGDVFLCVHFVGGPKIINNKHPVDLYTSLLSDLSKTYHAHYAEEGMFLFSPPYADTIYKDLPHIINTYRGEAQRRVDEADKKDEIVDDMIHGVSDIDEEFTTWFEEEGVMWEMMKAFRVYRQERLANGKVNTNSVGHLMLPVLEKMNNAANEMAENKAVEVLK